jgi:ADP-ribose pyrophosphatase YjhB (NUDIX family)
MHHDRSFHYCPVCGEKAEKTNMKEGEPSRLVCTGCSYVQYLDPKVVACTICELNGKIVLLKRANNPQKGMWVMPGGYVDRGEEVLGAAIRETREECGIKVLPNEILGVYSYTGYIEVVIVYLAEYLSGNLAPKDETLEARLFAEEEIPWKELAFQSTTDALKDYYRLKCTT